MLSISWTCNSTCCPLQPMIHRASFQVNKCQQAHCTSQSQCGSHRAKSLTSQCFRSDVTRVHISLHCGHRQQFPKHQIKNEKRSCVDVFHSARAPSFVATARAVLLSALVCTGNGSPISFRMACVKITSADGAPRAFHSECPLGQGNNSLSLALAGHQERVNMAQYKKWLFSSSGLQPSQRQSIP